MKKYTMKSFTPLDYMVVKNEIEDGFVVCIVKNHGDSTDVTTDFISRDLFENCVRSGYLSPFERTYRLAANA